VIFHASVLENPIAIVGQCCEPYKRGLSWMGDPKLSSKIGNKWFWLIANLRHLHFRGFQSLYIYIYTFYTIYTYIYMYKHIRLNLLMIVFASSSIELQTQQLAKEGYSI
jgi:hypothetical protein